MHLFQTWKKLHPVPGVLEDSAMTWRTVNPTLHHHLFDDHFIVEWLRSFDGRYDWCVDPGAPFIRTVDLFRYAFLYEEGGLYADLDHVAVRPIVDFLEGFGRAAVLGEMQVATDPDEVNASNSIMFSGAPHHPLWALALAFARGNDAERSVNHATGPGMLTRAMAVYQTAERVEDLFADPAIGAALDATGLARDGVLDPVQVLPRRFFHPLGFSTAEDLAIVRRFRSAKALTVGLADGIDLASDDTYSYTYWFRSWSDGLSESPFDSRDDATLRELGLER